MSSSAFFIDAAANTVRVLFCARACEWAAPNRIVRATKNPARRCIGALRACLHALSARANQALVVCGMRQAEAPFRHPGRAYGRPGRSRAQAYRIAEVRAKAPAQRAVIPGSPKWRAPE